MANVFTNQNQPVDCRCCGKRTVSTMMDVAEGLCRPCSEDSLQENHHSDGQCEGLHYMYDKPCRFCDPTEGARACDHEAL